MNESLEKLYGIGKKDTRYIIGLMSGTSLDGLDVALCSIKGSGRHTSISLLKFITVAYDTDFKTEIKKMFSKKIVDLERLCLLNEWVGMKHAAIVNQCLQNWNIAPTEVDLIASHGQTIYHAPTHVHQDKKFGHSTLQIGDGDQLAVNTGIITISDFRQKHIAAGGEGAPLAAYGDFILFAEQEVDVLLLNIGGIANFTFIPAGAAFNKVTCSDIGPGNIMMDAYVQQQFPGKYFDDAASLAKKGTIHEPLLQHLLQNDFLTKAFPKTTGPELFNLAYLEDAIFKTHVKELSAEDILATLNAFTARLISKAIVEITEGSIHYIMYLSGGGIHNPLLMDNLKDYIPGMIGRSTSEKNIDPDAKEAVLFAVLANECVAGNGSELGEGSIHAPAITMGKISFPK